MNEQLEHALVSIFILNINGFVRNLIIVRNQRIGKRVGIGTTFRLLFYMSE